MTPCPGQKMQIFSLKILVGLFIAPSLIASPLYLFQGSRKTELTLNSIVFFLILLFTFEIVQYKVCATFEIFLPQNAT
jgi:hypothetical protein